MEEERLDKAYLNALREKDVAKIAGELAISASGKAENNLAAVYAAAYVLLKAAENETVSLTTFSSFKKTVGQLPEQRLLFLRDTLERNWNALAEQCDKFSVDDLRAVLLFLDDDWSTGYAEPTPVGVCQLAARIIHVQPGDEVADFCTGRGTFLRECFLMEPKAKYYANELRADFKEIAEIRAELLGADVVIDQGDMAYMPKENIRRFDRAFANFPLGQHYPLNMEIYRENKMSRVSSMDWVYCRKMYETIGGPGRAVCLMSPGSMWNSIDKEIRRSFILDGTVKAVIALPEKLFEHTNISIMMVVLGYGPNGGVMMVDARKECVSGRRMNILSEENINRILNACYEESEISHFVTNEELAKNGYVLNPARHTEKVTEVKDGVPFGSVVRNITRGSQLSADELDALSTTKETHFRFATISDIQDGMFRKDLPFLTEIDEKQKKYCLKKNMLVISKISVPVKAAMADPKEEQILAAGNLFLIEVDEKKMNPFYLKAFLESEEGTSVLRHAVTGCKIPSISLNQLKNMQVPCPPMEEQNRVAQRYQEYADQLIMYRRLVEKAAEKMKHVLDEESEE